MVIAITGVGVALAAGGDNSADSAASADRPADTTERPAATTTTQPQPVVIGRDTEIAVRECIEAFQGLGAEIAYGDPLALDTAESTCDTATVMLDTDDGGMIGPIPSNTIALTIAERMMDASSVNLTAALSGRADASADAVAFDNNHYAWAAEVEALLDQ